MSEEKREGGLSAPTRHPLNQHDPIFHDATDLNNELARVYDICHGCRRCVSLCNAFPVLFDLVDGSPTLEVDGVAVADYQKVVDQCYLCDLCYMTKCPYVPPHEWNVDFPHLMLRAKIVNYENGNTKLRDNIITSTDLIGKVATMPVINTWVNAANRNETLRGALDSTMQIHKDARLPEYKRPTLRQTLQPRIDAMISEDTDARVILFTTCYCNYNEPDLGDSLYKVLRHNDVTVEIMAREYCCGMPKLELGDLKSVDHLLQKNIPQLFEKVQKGWKIIAPVPSCVLMFKQELPLLYPDDERVLAVGKAFFDPFEYLHKLHKDNRLKTEFVNSLGNVSYHVACHQRVQNIGPKTKQILELIPGTSVKAIERCSGHDGTYGVKKESLAFANKIVQPVVRQIKQQTPDYYGSDCPVAGRHIENNLKDMDSSQEHAHPLDLLCKAYGI
ncbi:MAG: heterodisulfide reductase-related iron-sulfur binding cluster [Gammaproteobacteria bacterium]|nr:heterodisulfide reductase-related iron-sulfur binding cluster [Gammaproteobacteria bacterium]MDP2141568.1 heterodisulfide reductase-related iron-sulfur binding cluster [Gammaproteobacteria bacterium]MDP2346676.1 heterodisulfide reductase-related iron-sulfur binding cluster [Gammaproteobacteria bacterium]